MLDDALFFLDYLTKAAFSAFFFLGRTISNQLFFIVLPSMLTKISFWSSKDNLFCLNFLMLVIVAMRSVLREKCIYNNQLWGCVIQYKALSCESK